MHAERFIILTGLYPNKHGATHLKPVSKGNASGIHDYIETYPEDVERHGYATALYGKYHLMSRPRGVSTSTKSSSTRAPTRTLSPQPHPLWTKVEGAHEALDAEAVRLLVDRARRATPRTLSVPKRRTLSPRYQSRG